MVGCTVLCTFILFEEFQTGGPVGRMARVKGKMFQDLRLEERLGIQGLDGQLKSICAGCGTHVDQS